MHPIFDERRYLIPFRAVLLPQIFTDVLVVGSGVAGMRAAIAAAEHSDVIVLSKGRMDQSNTSWAQGGVAVTLDPSDSFDAHLQDTVDAGAGLVDERRARQIIEAGPARIEELLNWGMPADRSNGDLLFTREGGHSARRIIHCDGDATGKAMALTLIDRAKRSDRVRMFDQCFALDLITEGPMGSNCLGAITHHPKYGLQVIWARATILATGGCGKIYRESTNAPIAHGDGHAMAYRAGATLQDMEFEQFHPTTLYIAGAARSLISEAVRGEGAHLINRAGTRFMVGEHDLAELAPRDVVARAILKQVGDNPGASVYLDARHFDAGFFAERFPGIAKLLGEFGLNAEHDLIPIRPAMHYMIGGVVVDELGRTGVPGLYACGEVTSTGLHGANRLASNSLLEGLVCGEAAGRACREMQDAAVTLPLKIVSDIPLSEKSELDIADVKSSLRSVMWRHVGIERDGARLAEVAEMFDFWARYTLDKIFDEREGWEVQNALLVGAIITRAASWRRESRGTHYRVDCPAADEAMRVRARWQRESPDVSIVDAE